MGPVIRWHLARGVVELPRGAVMGIVNVTPDSFSDGGRWTSGSSGTARVDSVVAEVRRWASLGVRVVDVGGESIELREETTIHTDAASGAEVKLGHCIFPLIIQISATRFIDLSNN